MGRKAEVSTHTAYMMGLARAPPVCPQEVPNVGADADVLEPTSHSSDRVGYKWPLRFASIGG